MVKTQEVTGLDNGRGALWQEELGCGEGKRTEDGWVWQERKSSIGPLKEVG